MNAGASPHPKDPDQLKPEDCAKALRQIQEILYFDVERCIWTPNKIWEFPDIYLDVIHGVFNQLGLVPERQPQSPDQDSTAPAAIRA